VFKKIIFFFLTIINLFGLAQKDDSAMYVFKKAERELKDLQKKAFHSKTEKDRLEGNKEFMREWEKVITNPKILQYPFDSLKDISVLSPKDKKFKLITWNFHREDGTHAFFGYLLVNNSKRIKKGFMKYETEDAYEYFRLIDRSPTVKYPETYVGSPDKWFGMLYTQLVECDGFYTLIGWDGNDKLTTRKFVDVLYFRSNGAPFFGKDVFKFPRKNPRRLMFEYSSEVSMSLKYNEKRNQIVYSHLGAKQEGTLLEGQFQYYGPDGSFDALELKKGRWVTLEDVDARNDKSENDTKSKPDLRKHKKRMPGSKAK